MRVRGPAADPDILHRLQEQGRSGNDRHLPPEPGDHAVRGKVALAERHQRHEHEAAIGLAAAGEADDGVDRGVLLDDGDELGELLLHELERDALVGLDDAGDPPGILLREEALRDDAIQIEVQAEHRGEDYHYRSRVLERAGQRSPIEPQHRIEEALAHPIKPAVALAGFSPQQHRAHHRRGCERNRQRDQDRYRDRHRKFAEQSADDAAHQQDRDEHRDQRDAHGEHGEADFVGALQRRFQRRQPALDVAGDVFQHDNGVVDDESGRDRQRHQRQIVEAVADQVHGAERGDQRHRDRDHRNDGRPQVPQEREHHDDHQHHRDDQRALDVAQRGADGGRTVDPERDIDRRRDRGAELRHHRLDQVDGRDDVGAGLPVEDDQDRRLAVGESGVAQVLDPVGDLADVGQMDRGAVAVGDDQGFVIIRLVGLIVGVDLIALVADVDAALRAVRIGARKRGAHVLKTDAVFVDRLRDQIDADRGQRAAADVDFADALDLRQLLRQHGGRRVVEIAAGQGVGGQRKDQDRRVRRVDLFIGRIAAQAGR